MAFSHGIFARHFARHFRSAFARRLHGHPIGSAATVVTVGRWAVGGRDCRAVGGGRSCGRSGGQRWMTCVKILSNCVPNNSAPNNSPGTRPRCTTERAAQCFPPSCNALSDVAVHVRAWWVRFSVSLLVCVFAFLDPLSTSVCLQTSLAPALSTAPTHCLPPCCSLATAPVACSCYRKKRTHVVRWGCACFGVIPCLCLNLCVYAHRVSLSANISHTCSVHCANPLPSAVLFSGHRSGGVLLLP
jgi:hypothetical protein